MAKVETHSSRELLILYLEAVDRDSNERIMVDEILETMKYHQIELDLKVVEKDLRELGTEEGSVRFHDLEDYLVQPSIWRKIHWQVGDWYRKEKQIETAFHMLDVNKDAHVSISEFVRLGIPEEKAALVFYRRDKDKNMALNYSEFRTLMMGNKRGRSARLRSHADT